MYYRSFSSLTHIQTRAPKESQVDHDLFAREFSSSCHRRRREIRFNFSFIFVFVPNRKISINYCFINEKHTRRVDGIFGAVSAATKREELKRIAQGNEKHKKYKIQNKSSCGKLRLLFSVVPFYWLNSHDWQLILILSLPALDRSVQFSSRERNFPK